MTAQLTALLASIYRQQGSSPYKAADFIPTWAGEELTDEEEWAIMNTKFDSYNRRVAVYEAKQNASLLREDPED
jgi:hypothetical protein